jgi:hypothetical protein
MIEKQLFKLALKEAEILFLMPHWREKKKIAADSRHTNVHRSKNVEAPKKRNRYFYISKKIIC